ncbi:hypothetical protein [Paenibacillus koleovorans]|uniref:hypothetical protein n=1 Tax=Paenibacillus koleovorans TaxID=121608 RepID=UPI000FDBC48D|nr:hypothetical protein [Paenibacillus koleovorans]
MITCPNCRSKDIGIIAPEHYYCWGCYIEMKQAGDRLDLFQVEEDGSLSSLNDLFYEDVQSL